MAICGSGVGAAVYANKVKGAHACLIYDHFSARQGVEDDHMNILCMGGRTVGPEVDLCWVWDNNHITIEGNTGITFTEDVAARFLAYGWNVLRVGDANDIERIEHALAVFHKSERRSWQ